MRASRRPIALAVLLLGAALVVAPSTLSASPASNAPPAFGALDQAWRVLSQVGRWLGGSSWLDDGPGADPNGHAAPAPPPPGARPAAGRPSPGARPNNGPGADPNGGAAPQPRAPIGPP
jgi:hypothetical protein